jgi:hypothetical protein
MRKSGKAPCGSRSKIRYYTSELGLGKDLTYIPMARGFVYLAIVLDWATARFWRGGYRSR